MAGYASEEEEAPCNLDAEVAQFVTKLHADGLLPAEELDGFSHIPTACIEASGAYLEQIPKVCRLAIESQTLSALLALFARLEQEAPGTVGWRAVAGVLTQALHEVEKQTAEAADELRAATPQIDYELFGLPKPPEPAAPESKTGSAPHPRSEGKERKRRKGNAVPVAATSKLRHSAQLAKWQAVQQSAMQAEEAAAGARDSEAQRAQQAEEWRLSQLRSGASDGNANFAETQWTAPEG
ncbi:hypothetical protein F751_3364 [Auxenochlorella protothecoides]|uniref:Uncharacterized protein n=1 Tax=Auxenochlorella protothecoides TaxID=3075 RepID=A0A087SBR9_AUXPR|nr:hypothetical protein F751_3364 [Auxenochlorella protothecoides]KFM23173.1 hypothetical protein F751_3364 [Auxenochlorella protothecoides]